MNVEFRWTEINLPCILLYAYLFVLCAISSYIWSLNSKLKKSTSLVFGESSKSSPGVPVNGVNDAPASQICHTQ